MAQGLTDMGGMMPDAIPVPPMPTPGMPTLEPPAPLDAPTAAAASMPPSATPVPLPVPRPQPAKMEQFGPPIPPELGKSLEPQATTGQAAAQGQPGDKLLAALRGVQAPAKPDVVKPTSPAAPALKTVQGGDFLAMLQALSNPRRPMASPPTLGGALGIGRY